MLYTTNGMLWIAIKHALPTHTSCTHLYLSIYLYYSWRSTRRYRQRLTDMARISTPGRTASIAPESWNMRPHSLPVGREAVDAVAGHLALSLAYLSHTSYCTEHSGWGTFRMDYAPKVAS